MPGHAGTAPLAKKDAEGHTEEWIGWNLPRPNAASTPFPPRLPMQPNTTLRRPVMTYVDGFIVPLPNGKEGEYRKIAETFAKKAQAQGAIGTIEALGDGLEHGHTTDFFRAVKAEDNENVVFSFILWPSKDVRDAAWKKLMADPDMQPGTQPMPFDGKRMFWGGFKPLLNTLEKTGVPS